MTRRTTREGWSLTAGPFSEENPLVCWFCVLGWGGTRDRGCRRSSNWPWPDIEEQKKATSGGPIDFRFSFFFFRRGSIYDVQFCHIGNFPFPRSLSSAFFPATAPFCSAFGGFCCAIFYLKTPPPRPNCILAFRLCTSWVPLRAVDWWKRKMWKLAFARLQLHIFVVSSGVLTFITTISSVRSVGRCASAVGFLSER